MNAETFRPIDSDFLDRSLAERFEYVVDCFPDLLAVDDGVCKLSYRELNNLANLYAAEIIECSTVEHQGRIAIFMEKDVRYIAAIIAVLKSGNVYVPMDVEFPLERNKFILKDSSVALVLSTAAQQPITEALVPVDCQQINLDKIDTSTNHANPDIDIAPTKLAYILYTSGSTGNPKGVMQSHRNVLHGCMRRTKLQKIVPSDCITLLYSCSVMGSIYCIYGALLNGASLHLYSVRSQGLDNLADWLISHKISIYHSVASVFRAFCACNEDKKPQTFIRLVIFGGEKVLTSDIELARSVFGRAISFFTGLGSTETGTVRYFLIDPSLELESSVVPIGYPIEGVTVELVDDAGTIVPSGDIGEIKVRSPYVGLGYWNNKAASDEVFSIDENDPDVRIYRMGDLAEERSEGLLVHRGRKDFQIKIRGFRVETNEVESALLDHSDIADAVVVAKDFGQEAQLVAYIVPANAGAVFSVKVLNGHLKERLPYYMMPSMFVALEALPKTPNNKVDRQALPEPLPSNQVQDETPENASTATEKLLVEISRTLLKRPVVGINHNFFDIGGDSLAATQLVARVNETLGVNLTMNHVFSAEDIKSLAKQIDSLAVANPVPAEEQSSVALSTDEPVPLSYAQRIMWVRDRLHGASAAFNISNSVYLEGKLNIEALNFAFNKILQRHDILRTIFPSNKGRPYQEVTAYSPINIPILDLSDFPEGTREVEATKRVQKSLQRPHNLASGPLIEFELIKLNEQKYVFSLVLNHIIYDNIWSSGLFFQELSGWYHSFIAKASSPFKPPLKMQFADYVSWEKTHLTPERLSEHLGYWAEQLSELPPPSSLPEYRDKEKQAHMPGGQITFKVPNATRLPLTNLAKSERSTMFMTFLVAWQLLLSQLSGQKDILIGTPSGRRYLPETEEMIGLFINTLVIRTRFDDSLAFRELLKQLRTNVLQAFTHDEVPFELLVRELKPVRVEGRSPFFSHFFIHRNSAQKAWYLDDLNLTPMALHSGRSKFDTTLSILEDEYQVVCTIEYSTDLFNRDRIEQIAETFVQLLAAVSEDPDTSIYQLKETAEKQLA